MANFNVGGFNVTQDPPSPSGYNSFPDNTQPVSLGASAVEVIPLQNIELGSPNPSGTAIFRLDDGQNSKYSARANCFIISPGSDLSILLDITTNCPLVPLTFSMIVAVETTNTIQAKFNISVNGHDQDPVEEVGEPYNVYHQVQWSISPNVLKSGQINTIKILSSGHHSKNNLWISSLSAQSITGQTINAYYYWKSVFTCTADTGDKIEQSVAIANGITTTDTQTYSFAETLGISAEGKAEVPLVGALSYTINTSFTATQSLEHSVAITQSETNTTTLGVDNPTEKISVQFWQLCLGFECNGKYIEQLIGLNQVPGVIETRYPATAIANVLVKKIRA